MNKHVLTFLVFLSFSIFSKGAILSGNITSSQTLSGKIEITDNVMLAPGVTLSFAAGASLNFDEGTSIKADSSTTLIFNGTSSNPVLLNSLSPGTFWGVIECKGADAMLEMHHVNMQAGHIRITDGARAYLEDSYFRDYYEGSIPIIYSEDAASVLLRRCLVSNYYEINLVRTLALIEDCMFQFMTADGIDLDNSPPGTTIRRCTIRNGRGTNIDAIDFGKVDFMGNGSIGLVQQCRIYDISDKGVSVGEGAQEITVEGCLFYHCGAGVAVKDNSYSRIFNNTFVSNDFGVELVEKNPGLGGGHGYTYNNIFWDNEHSVYLNSTATVEIFYSDFDDLQPDSLNFNISADPLFLNASNHDYRLNAGSPAIGSGFENLNMGAYFPNGANFNKSFDLHLGIPNSFSQYGVGDTVNITWSGEPSVSTVNILFSSDDGAQWQTLASGVDVNTLVYTWIVPSIYSTQCRIRIENAGNKSEYAENYLPFKIIPLENDGFTPSFSLLPGYYSTPQQLTLSAQSGDIIYYSTDGSDPTDRSEIYTGPLELGYDSIPGGQAEQNITASNPPHQPYAYIRTAPLSQIGPNPTIWYAPTGTIFKAHAIRARIYRPGVGLGPVITKTYFVDPKMNNKRYTLPVISLVSDPVHLFDYYSGVYIPGVDFTGYSFTGNYERKGRISEQPAHLELFSSNGRMEISQNIGFRIRGEWIRSTGQKALTIFARSEYDEQNKFDYQLFPGQLKPEENTLQTKYKRFIIRNAGNEWGWAVNSMCRDMLIQSLFDRLDLKYQAGRPSVVFLNGEYWGVQNIRELNDKRGLQYSYGVDPDSVIMMEDNLDGPFQLIEGNDGDVQAYHSMRNFVLNNDMSLQPNYDSLKTMLDIENFTDYWIATVYSNKRNTDHNTSYWKLRNGKPGPGVRESFDGRWRWIANDFENGFADPADDNFGWMLYVVKDSLLKRLIVNQEFRTSFLNRFADLLNSSFSTAHVLKKIEYYKGVLEPEMPEHIVRWRTPASMSYWEQALDNFRNFATDRPAVQFNQLMSRLGISRLQGLTVDVNEKVMGKIKVNSLTVDPSLPGTEAQVYPWSGSYFQNVPVTITAYAYDGYRFVRWQETGETNPQLILPMNGATFRTAIFERDPGYYAGLTAIYPNPLSGDKLHFHDPSKVKVYDMDGRLLLQRDELLTEIDLHNLRGGVYFISLNDAGKIRFVRL